MASILDFDEIRRLAGETYEKARNEPIETRKKQMEDWFEELLIDAYIAGFTGTGLPVDLVMDPEHVNLEVIHKSIDGKTVTDRISEHIENEAKGLIENLAESEAHRVSENGGYDAAEQASQKLRRLGYVVFGKWATMRDNKVRDTHDYLEGMEVPFGERFFSYDGDSARFPGDFHTAQNNVGCRCGLKYSLRRI